MALPGAAQEFLVWLDHVWRDRADAAGALDQATENRVRPSHAARRAISSASEGKAGASMPPTSTRGRNVAHRTRTRGRRKRRNSVGSHAIPTSASVTGGGQKKTTARAWGTPAVVYLCSSARYH